MVVYKMRSRWGTSSSMLLLLSRVGGMQMITIIIGLGVVVLWRWEEDWRIICWSKRWM